MAFTSALFSPDSTRLAVGGDMALVVIDTADLSTRLAVSLDSAMSVAFGPDGKTLAVGTITRLVQLWSLTTNRELAELKHTGRTGWIQVALSPDGRTLAANSRDSLSVWSLGGADERREFAGHAAGVTGVSFSPDGTTLASTSKDGTVKLWEPATGHLRRTLGGYPADVQVCAFSPDETMLATGSMDKGGIRIWDTRSWQEVYAAKVDAENINNITGLVFLRGAGRDLGLAATSRGSGLGIWRVKRTTDARPALQPIVQHDGYECLHLALSHDGELAAYIESNYIVKVWDVARARELEFSGPRALIGWHSLAFRSARDLVYISSDRVAVVWDAAANRMARTIGTPGRFEGSHIAVSPDGRWLAAEATPSSVAIADLERGEVIFTFRDERSPIWSLAWSPDARRLAVGLSDGGLVLWDLERVRAVLADAGIAAVSTSAHRDGPLGARPVAVLDLDRVQSLHQPDRDLDRAGAAATSSRWEEAAAAFRRTFAEGVPDRPEAGSSTQSCVWPSATWRVTVLSAKTCSSRSTKTTNERGCSSRHARCALAPNGPAEEARAVQLAEKRMSVFPDTSWSKHVLGLALDRAGRFAEADIRIRGNRASDLGWDYHVLDWLVLAMANHQLGRPDEARAAGAGRPLGRDRAARPSRRGRSRDSERLALA